VVRRDLHGEQADGVLESALRLFAVLPEERGAATDHDAKFFKAAIQFIGLQAIGIGLCIVFPQIVLWLPSEPYARY
jgi:hypothetical protein